MNIIITGGGISNKGAQSMLFIATEQLKRRYPDDKIVVMTLSNSGFDGFKFEVGLISFYALKCVTTPMNWLRRMRYRVKPHQIAAVDTIFREARMLVDISGYALGSNWADATVDYYLSYFECAKKYNVPVYVMPQSFGPFDYPEDSPIMKRIASTMSYPKVIYAREQEGYDLLTQRFGLKNVKTSCDMVLCSKSASPENIYRELPPKRSLPRISENSVAIIPNVRNCDQLGNERTLQYYCAIATEALKSGKTLYIMHHSSEDAPLCVQIVQALGENDRVIHLSEDFDCFEYETLVQKFDYIIASRYHAIVHALKNSVPCIAFGWATKYHEVLELCDLAEYSFDVRGDVVMGEITEAIQSMNQSLDKIKTNLRNVVEHLQQRDLFYDELKDY